MTDPINGTPPPIGEQRLQVSRVRNPGNGGLASEGGTRPTARQQLAEDGKIQPPPAADTTADAAVEGLRDAIDEVQNYLQRFSRDLEISVDEELGATVVRVIDTATEELVRQIPAEDVLEIARFLRGRDATTDEASATIVKGMLLNRQG
ncbi:MAG: flagellar protein FlaG [Pseudomonadota bacterium]